MEKLARVKKMAETREVASKTTGEMVGYTDIIIEWTVAQPGRESYEQSCACTVRGWINRDALANVIATNKEVLVTIYTKAREWNDKFFTAVDCYLPKEYMLDAKPF